MRLRRKRDRIVLAIYLIVGAFCPARAQDPVFVLEDSVAKIVEKTESAVVSIARIKPPDNDGYHGDLPEFPRPRKNKAKKVEADLLPNEYGTGILLSPANGSELCILTSYHVVRGGPVFPEIRSEDQTQIRIHFSDRRSCLASLYAADPRSDLAVLKVTWSDYGLNPKNYHAMDWQSAAAVRKGQFVVLYGNPYSIARDGSASVSWGIVSNLTRQPILASRGEHLNHEQVAERSMLNHLGMMMQLDARLNLGTSGGPVLNLKGELVGVATSLAAIEGHEQSTGFAFPVDSATRWIVQTLLEGREVEYGMLGVFPSDMTVADFARIDTGLRQPTAVLVKETTPGSPADFAGILRESVIVTVEGVPVLTANDLMRTVGINPPGRSIAITIWQNNHLLSLKVRLAKWPVKDEDGIIETNPRFKPWRGLSIDYATARSFPTTGVNIGSAPVVVTKVVENSPGNRAFIQSGDFITKVNQISVQTPAEFHAAVRTVTGKVKLTLLDFSENADRRSLFDEKQTSVRVVEIGE